MLEAVRSYPVGGVLARVVRRRGAWGMLVSLNAVLQRDVAHHLQQRGRRSAISRGGMTGDDPLERRQITMRHVRGVHPEREKWDAL